MRTIGLEREWYITKNGQIGAHIGEVLPFLKEALKFRELPENRFDFELFAGQLEERTDVCHTIKDIKKCLRSNREIMKLAESKLGVKFLCLDFIEKEKLNELVVNPFDERHKHIWNELNESKKVYASQVAALHVHVSVTAKEAVQVLNFCREEVLEKLIFLNKKQNYKRILAYREMTGSSSVSPLFINEQELMWYIDNNGGEKNVWDFVRYKPSTKTIEFRMFGTTDDDNVIEKILESCLEIVKYV